MNKSNSVYATVLGALISIVAAAPAHAVISYFNPAFYAGPDFNITSASAVLSGGNVTFSMAVEGTAAGTAPLSGIAGYHPVLGYVWLTNLKSSDIGFNDTPGTVALVVPSHDDFDDTPLFNENGINDEHDDGAVYHAHWAVLTDQERDDGGLSVKKFTDGVDTPTSTFPDFPIFLDSPGFVVQLNGNTISVVVPEAAVSNWTGFSANAVTAFMEVHEDGNPLLGVYGLYSGPVSVNVVPEPSSVAMLSVGLLGLLGRSWSRRKAVA